MQTVAILHNIRSVANVASIFRTADAAGISHLYLTGYTPTPTDRFGRLRADFKKVSLGAERTVPFTASRRIDNAVSNLQERGFVCVAVEQSPKSVSYVDPSLAKLRRIPVALIVGNEVRGLSSAILAKADILIEIPMSGTKESLNVAVAFGVAAFRFRDGIRR